MASKGRNIIMDSNTYMKESTGVYDPLSEEEKLDLYQDNPMDQSNDQQNKNETTDSTSNDLTDGHINIGFVHDQMSSDDTTISDVKTVSDDKTILENKSISDSKAISDAKCIHSNSNKESGGKVEIKIEQLTENPKKDSGKVDKGETNFSLLSGNGELSPVSENTSTITLFRRRYLMLALFCIFSFSNAYQWIHLNIISNVVASYYNESLPNDEYQRNTAIDWLSVVYMLAYIPLIIPVTWFLDKRGLRQCCIVGSFLNLLGSALKCASVAPDRFPLLMFSQTICAIAQLFVLGIPARLAAVWFGPNEVSTATSLGVFGNQAGIAFGFLVPPILVPNSEDTDIITKGFYIMFGAGSFVIGVIFLLICIFFQEKPPQPPSRAQQLSVEAAIHENYLQSLKRLFQNQGFIILMISYGCNTGSFYAISTLLNAIILNYFKGEEENAGRIGLTIIVMGILGSVLAGILLDRTKAFKATTIGIYFLCLLSTLAFTFTLDLDVIAVVFVTAGALGFFMTGYLPVGFEFAAELTFPESEATSSGLLNASAQVFGIILTLGMRAMMDTINVLIANITMCAILLFGTIISCLIKADYRRQAAGKTFHSQERT